VAHQPNTTVTLGTAQPTPLSNRGKAGAVETLGLLIGTSSSMAGLAKKSVTKDRKSSVSLKKKDPVTAVS
jgi:hypothetical protein